MSRQMINLLVAGVALGGVIVIGSTNAWSNIVGPVGAQAYVTKAEFDQAFIDTTTASRAQNTATYREKLRDLGWKRLNAAPLLK